MLELFQERTAAMEAIRVRPLPLAADRAGLRPYRAGGMPDGLAGDGPTDYWLAGYWLSPALFGSGMDGAPSLAAPGLVDAAIGRHLCRLRRPLGPREIRFLRAGLGVSQAGLGRLLGYRDKQRVAAAEKRTGAPRRLVPTAEMLLRSHYLGMHGPAQLSGDEYRRAAMAIAAALTAPPADLPQTEYLVTL